MPKLFLGIDTSNYKTSIAVVDEMGAVIYSQSDYLDVPQGKRGLRQSDAFFKHSNRLPEYIIQLRKHVNPKDIVAVGASERPRRLEGSYMPCFLPGMNLGSELSTMLDIPLYSFSHQEGHAAAIIEHNKTITYYCKHNKCSQSSKSLLFHLSGGTTEFLLCNPDDDGYELEIVGGSLDISVGQLVDRIGVAMGLPFPSGQFMDEIAMNASIEPSSILPKLTIKDGYFNLSGAETKLLRAMEVHSDIDRTSIILEVFNYLADLLDESITFLKSKYGINSIYMAGGISSSVYLRSKLQLRGSGIVFGEPCLSSDNAVGIALLARRKFRNR